MAYIPSEMRSFYEDTVADTTRDRIARGGMPRQFGGTQPDAYLRQPWNDFFYDPARDYERAAYAGAGPKGGAAMSTRDRMETVDAARNIRARYDQIQAQRMQADAARKAAMMDRGRATAVNQGGGGPPASAMSGGGNPPGMTRGADGVLTGAPGPSSYAPPDVPAKTTGAVGGGVAGGSPMQTAAYKAGLAQGPGGGSRFAPSAASQRMGGFATDRFANYAPNAPVEGSLDAAIGFELPPPSSSRRLDDSDLQMFLAQDRGAPISEADAIAMAAAFGGYDPYAPARNAQFREGDAERGGSRAADEFAMVNAALDSENEAVARAARASIAPTKRAAVEASAIQDAILRSKTGQPSPWEQEELDRQFGLKTSGLDLEAEQIDNALAIATEDRASRERMHGAGLAEDRYRTDVGAYQSGEDRASNERIAGLNAEAMSGRYAPKPPTVESVDGIIDSIEQDEYGNLRDPATLSTQERNHLAYLKNLRMKLVGYSDESSAGGGSPPPDVDMGEVRRVAAKFGISEEEVIRRMQE